MVGFGGKQAWLEVRDGDPAEVLRALGLRDLGEVRWRDGIDLAHLTDDRVAVTPSLAGARGTRWVLAAGRYLLRPGTAVDAVALSAELGTEVQFLRPTGSPRCTAGSAPSAGSRCARSGTWGRPAR